MIRQAIITHYRTEEAKAYRKIHGDRGRADGDWYSNPHSQRLEIGDCISNAISSIAKDFMIIINYE